MVGKVVAATAAEQEVMGIIKVYCGCLPCMIEDRVDVHCTIQHVTEGRKRAGQWAVYGLCGWHHFGTPWPFVPGKEMSCRFGPSMALSKRDFVETYGTERQLVELQAYMVSLFRLSSWEPFEVPASVVVKVKSFWVKLMAGN